MSRSLQHINKGIENSAKVENEIINIASYAGAPVDLSSELVMAEQRACQRRAEGQVDNTRVRLLVGWKPRSVVTPSLVHFKMMLADVVLGGRVAATGVRKSACHQ